MFSDLPLQGKADPESHLIPLEIFFAHSGNKRFGSGMAATVGDFNTAITAVFVAPRHIRRYVAHSRHNHLIGTPAATA